MSNTAATQANAKSVKAIRVPKANQAKWQKFSKTTGYMPRPQSSIESKLGKLDAARKIINEGGDPADVRNKLCLLWGVSLVSLSPTMTRMRRHLVKNGGSASDVPSLPCGVNAWAHESKQFHGRDWVPTTEQAEQLDSLIRQHQGKKLTAARELWGAEICQMTAYKRISLLLASFPNLCPSAAKKRDGAARRQGERFWTDERLAELARMVVIPSMSDKELAAFLGCSIDNVKRRICTLRAMYPQASIPHRRRVNRFMRDVVRPKAAQRREKQKQGQ